MSGTTTLTTGKLVLTNTTGNNDASDKLRVTSPVTLFDLNSAFGKQPTVMNELLTNTQGIATSNSYISYTYNYVSGSAYPAKAVSQSHTYVPYQSGSSRLIQLTGVLEASAGGTTGSISRIGCFDDAADKSTNVPGTGNGHFFQLGPGSGTANMYVCERSYSTSSSTDVLISQSNWNIDTMMGTGPSGFSISNWGNAMIFVIDLLWLGIGRVRMGLLLNGQVYYVHYFSHSGCYTGSYPPSSVIYYPYIKMAKLPIRYELNISSSAGAAAEMRMMCSCVVSEMGFTTSGRSLSYMMAPIVSPVLGPTISASVYTPIISISLPYSEPANRMTIAISGINILNTGSNPLAWQLLSLPGSYNTSLAPYATYLTGATFAVKTNYPMLNAAATIDTATTAITGAGFTASTVVTGNYIASVKQSTVSAGFNANNFLVGTVCNSAISGYPQILTLCAMGIGGTTTVLAGFTWYEIY